jgi:hypothetical protein
LVRFSLKQSRSDRDPYQWPLRVGGGSLFSPILGVGVGILRWCSGSGDTSYGGDETRGNSYRGRFCAESFYLSWQQRQVMKKMAVGKSIREAVREVLLLG